MTKPSILPLKNSFAIAIAIAISITLAMSPAFSAMPTFLSRLFRPLTSSARLGVAPDGSGSGSAAAAIPEGAEKATVAAGCFWGVEHLYRKQFGGRGLYDARVGYIGGDAENPTYKAVCTGKTGHSEALQIHYDPSRMTYRQVLEFFFRMHDPTTAGRQGPDVGPQYRSGVYWHTAEQERVAREVARQAAEQWYGGRGGRLTTELAPAGTWWDAEDYHQLYLDRNPGGYECPSHFVRPFPPLEDK